MILNSLEYGAVILVSPDENLRYGPEGLHQEAAVGLRHGLVAGQHGVEVPETNKKKSNKWPAGGIRQK